VLYTNAQNKKKFRKVKVFPLFYLIAFSKYLHLNGNMENYYKKYCSWRQKSSLMDLNFIVN